MLNKKVVFGVSETSLLSHAAMEVGPQPHGVIRANVFTAMQEAVHLTLEWVRLFNSGTEEATLPSMLGR